MDQVDPDVRLDQPRLQVVEERLVDPPPEPGADIEELGRLGQAFLELRQQA